MRKVLALMSVCLFSFGAWAADSQLKADEVMVTATRTEKVAKEVPMTLSVVTEESIKQTGASSVGELLRDVPGVQLTSTGSAGVFRLNLRGESGSRSLVMIDGVKISEQKSMDGAALLIDVSSIERVEVIKGPASVLYGSEAIGGAINIITKKGGKKPISGTVTATYNSGTDGFDNSLAFYGSKNGIYYRAEGSTSKHGDRTDSDSDDIDNTSFENKSYRVLMGYKKDKFDIGVEHASFRSDNEVRTGIENNPAFSLNMDLPQWNRSKTSAHAELKKLGKVLSKVRLDVYRQYTFKKFHNDMGMVKQMGPMTMNMKSLSKTENDMKSTGVNFQADMNLSETNLLVAGFEYASEDLDVHDRKMSFGQKVFSFYDSKAKQESKSLFVQDEQMIGDNVILSGGVRYVVADTKLSDTNNPSYTKDSSDTKGFVGSVSVVYTGIKNSSLRALYSRGYRTPNLQQLYMGTSHGGRTPTYSNPELDPETSDNFEVGFRYDNKAFDLDASLFYNSSKDYITTTAYNVGGQDARKFDNVDKAKTTGLELVAGYSVANFRPYTTATFLHRKYESETLSTSKTGQPKYFGRLGLKYGKTFKKSFFSADTYVRYAGDAEEELSSGSTDKTDGYTTLNLKLNGGFKLNDGRNVTLTAELLNLTNKEYNIALSPLEEPGRHFILKAAFDF